jgi:hypothetical protein
MIAGDCRLKRLQFLVPQDVSMPGQKRLELEAFKLFIDTNNYSV